MASASGRRRPRWYDTPPLALCIVAVSLLRPQPAGCGAYEAGGWSAGAPPPYALLIGIGKRAPSDAEAAAAPPQRAGGHSLGKVKLCGSSFLYAFQMACEKRRKRRRRRRRSIDRPAVYQNIYITLASSPPLLPAASEGMGARGKRSGAGRERAKGRIRRVMRYCCERGCTYADITSICAPWVW